MVPGFETLPPDFAEAFARVHGRTGRLGSRLLHVPVAESTNDLAWSLVEQGNSEGTVVISDAQTAGRGRRGRDWFSPPGSGLYVSVVVAPGGGDISSDRATSLLTLAAGVALAEALERVSGLTPDIKWPNDLVVGRRKLAGILAESTAVASIGSAAGQHASPRSVILGYGINVGPTAFPAALADRATSLESELGRPIERAVLWAESLVALGQRYDDLLARRFDAILDAWRRRAPGSRGARVEWETPDGRRRGITAGIDEQGALLVAVENRVERLLAGEVTWVP